MDKGLSTSFAQHTRGLTFVARRCTHPSYDVVLGAKLTSAAGYREGRDRVVLGTGAKDAKRFPAIGTGTELVATGGMADGGM